MIGPDMAAVAGRPLLSRVRQGICDGGRDRTRTGTPVSQKQILSLLCLPFHHAAWHRRCSTARARVSRLPAGVISTARSLPPQPARRDAPPPPLNPSPPTPHPPP